MRYIINLDKPLTDVDGSDTGQKLNRVLATLLKQSSTGDGRKYRDWAIDLTMNGKIQVDKSDFDNVLQFVRGNQQAWALVRGALEEELINQREAQDKAQKEKS